MTHRQNFLAMLTGNHPTRFPFDLPMTPPIVDRVAKDKGTRDVAAAFDLPFRGIGARFPDLRQKWLDAYARLGIKLPADVELWDTGIAHIKPPAESVGEAYHFRTMLHPLENVTSVEQLQSLPWSYYQDPASYAHFPKDIAAIRAAGNVSCAGLECTCFESSWYLRGMDNLYMDLVEGNPIADFLLDFFTNRSAHIAGLLARAGVDCIGLGDDVGTQRGMMMSVPMWQTHLKPRLAKVIAAIRAGQAPGQKVYVRYHSDGDIRDIIPDLIEIGVDILNPMQPECMPPDEVIAKYQDRLAFWGLIGTQSLMPFGTPADIRAFVARCVGWYKSGARLIIAPTHVLEPDVPYANITALADTLRATSL